MGIEAVESEEMATSYLHMNVYIQVYKYVYYYIYTHTILYTINIIYIYIHPRSNIGGVECGEYMFILVGEWMYG